MTTQFLFPRQCKPIGWLLFIPALLAAIYLTLTGFDFDNHGMTSVFAVASDEFMGKPQFMTVIRNSISDEILLTLIIVGGLLAGFSKLKNEDELLAKIRYESLVWAVYANFSIMLFSTVFVYGIYYFNVMIANIFTVLVFFIVRFHLMIYRLNKAARNEE